MRRTLLIDADILAYQAAAGNEEVFYFDGKDAPPVVEADLDGALAAADDKVKELQEKLKATHVVICLTDRSQPTFRADIWPAYKANRKGRKPEHLVAVLDHFAANYMTYKRARLEADDCMGILSTHPTLLKGEKIIVSEDKDMQTIPGLLFNPRHDDEPRKITKLQADRWHMRQTITGDATDNYPGAKGIGPKSPEVAAVMASKTVEEMWGHVLAAFRRANDKAKEGALVDVLVQAQALTQARCARILRASDWDFTSKRPRLWLPPTG
jgi:DNA polymerase-1